MSKRQRLKANQRKRRRPRTLSLFQYAQSVMLNKRIGFIATMRELWKCSVVRAYQK